MASSRTKMKIKAIVNWPIGIAVILLMTFGILEIGDVPNKDNLESATPADMHRIPITRTPKCLMNFFNDDFNLFSLVRRGKLVVIGS